MSLGINNSGPECIKSTNLDHASPKDSFSPCLNENLLTERNDFGEWKEGETKVVDQLLPISIGALDVKGVPSSCFPLEGEREQLPF